MYIQAVFFGELRFVEERILNRYIASKRDSSHILDLFCGCDFYCLTIELGPGLIDYL